MSIRDSKRKNIQTPAQRLSLILRGCINRNKYSELKVRIKNKKVYLIGDHFEVEFTDFAPTGLHFDLEKYLNSLSVRHKSIEKGVMKNFTVESSYPLEESLGLAVSFGEVSRAGLIRRGKVVMTFIVNGGDTQVFSDDHIHSILWIKSYTPIRFIKTRYPKIFRSLTLLEGAKNE